LGCSSWLTASPGAANREAKVQYCTCFSNHCRQSCDYAPASEGVQTRANACCAQGEITKDAIYQDAERRFEELEKETKRLHDESKKYAAF
jgi:hypothetical protein